MKFSPVLLTHIVICLLGSAVVLSIGTMHQATSFALGACLMAFNWAALGWSWGQILVKKSFALAVGVIVFKYAILGLSILILTKQAWVDGFYLMGGVATVLPTALVTVFINHWLERS